MSERHTGTVKRVDPEQGVGTLTSSKGVEFEFDCNAFVAQGKPVPTPGQPVTFELVPGGNRAQIVA